MAATITKPTKDIKDAGFDKKLYRKNFDNEGIDAYKLTSSDMEQIARLMNKVTGIQDHGKLAGLADDDHGIYILQDGTRAFTGSQSFGDFNITNVGILSVDSITGDANAIAIGDGGDTITMNPTSAVSFSDKAISNVSDIALDTISADNGSSFTISDNWTNAGNTVADLGIITTVDINGGTVDGTVIGGSTPAAGTFTTLNSTSFSLGPGDLTDVADIIFQTGATGGTLQTGTAVNDKYVLQAYDVDGAAYVTFFTLTAANDPTADLSTSVTMGGNGIYYATGTDVSVTDGGTGASTAANARSNLGLEIGVDVQAFDAGLASIAGLTTAADRMIYAIASDTYAVTTLTAFGRSLVDDADAGTARTTLGVAIGSDVQAWDAFLDDIAALTDPNANSILGWDDTAGAIEFLTVAEASTIIDHDQTTNFVANEHINHTGVTLTAGEGLSGGGDISANRTFSLDLSELTTDVSIAAGDKIAFTDITDNGNNNITFSNFESTLNLANLAGSVTDGQVPNTITLDNITQVTSRSHTDLSDIGTNSHASIDTHIADGTIHFTEGSIDHGSIAGLADDDHSIYILQDGTRAFTGSQSFGDFNITNVGDIALDTISADNGTSFTISDNWTNAGNTVADLGIITTVDINGGTIDGVTIGGAAAGVATFTDVTISSPVNIYSLDHDSFTGFVGNEHIDHTAITLTAGVGLSGGGDISANRTFTVDLNELATETSAESGDFIAMVDITDSGSGKITLANLATSLNTLGTVDHGNLAGLSDDDHSQYILVDGTRAFTGSQSFGDFNITNVGDIALDTISADSTDIKLTDQTFVQVSSTGTTPITGADEFIVEKTGEDMGMSILSDDNRRGKIIFGSPSDNDYAEIRGFYNSGSPSLQTYINGSFVGLIDSDGFYGFGTSSPSALFHVSKNISGTPLISGQYFFVNGATYTDNNTAASGTANNFASSAFFAPTLAASNTGVTTTNAATLYVDRDVIEGANETITNNYAVWIDDGAVRIDDMLGIGVTTATEKLDVAGKGRFESGVELVAQAATSEDGDLYNDSTRKALSVRVGGRRQGISTNLFSLVDDITSADTTSAASLLIGTGIGTTTIPADFLTIGKELWLYLGGRFSTTGSPTMRFRLFFASNPGNLMDTGAITVPTGSVTDQGWEAYIKLTCRTTGASGTVIGQGHVTVHGTNNTSEQWALVSTSTFTVDTTAAIAVNFLHNWGTASASNTITTTNASLEAITPPTI